MDIARSIYADMATQLAQILPSAGIGPSSCLCVSPGAPCAVQPRRYVGAIPGQSISGIHNIGPGGAFRAKCSLMQGTKWMRTGGTSSTRRLVCCAVLCKGGMRAARRYSSFSRRKYPMHLLYGCPGGRRAGRCRRSF